MSDSPWTVVAALVTAKIVPLQEGYTRTPKDRWAQRTLAELRHGDVTEPGAAPALWETTLSAIPEELCGMGDRPSRTESVVHATLVLYAMHQQSTSEPMHRRGIGLGDAVRRVSLSRKRSDAAWDSGTITRFHALCRAQSPSAEFQHLRSLIALMRVEGIGLDYGQLASDLWLLRTSKADNVRLRWGRQLHRLITSSPSETDTSKPEGETP